MTITSEFIDMAKEMLDDPEIGFDGILIAKIKTSTDRPWAPDLEERELPIRLFYTKASGGMVNGSLVLNGEKVFISYEPEGVSLANCVGSAFTDHTGERFVINAVEPIGAGNETVISYVKVGA